MWRGTEPGRQIPARRLAWLRGELAAWQAEGIIGAAEVDRIAARYCAGRRLALERLVLLLGGGFLGIGLSWLVAANLDQISPLTRFAGITLGWLVAVAVAEMLASRAAPEAVTGAARLVAVLAAGAVVFQAAQSLQVPAYTSSLLGVWAAGALAYAYATGALAPLVVAVVTGIGWYAWLVGERSASPAGFAASILVGAAVATAIAALHDRRGWRSFAGPWRQAGAVLALVGLFVVALPRAAEGQSVTLSAWLGLGAAVVAAGIALALGDRQGRREVLAVLGMVAAALLLLGWAPASGPGFGSELTGAQLVRAVTATVVYVVAAAWFAVVGTHREIPYLTFAATGALVVFVTVQSFAVFAPLLSGAALFLALGVVFLATGVLASIGRRRIVATVSEGSG